MRRRRERPTPVPIDRQEQVHEFCNRCRMEGRFAFDTEFVMEDRYESEVCLIQLATNQSVAIIDPFLELDLTGVWELVCDDAVETVVHAGQEDLALCARHAGKVPRRIFDVQIAAGLTGLDYPLSLQRLVQSMLHIRLHKSKTMTDWRQRPLTQAQLQYAAEDVAHLLPIHTTLRKRLEDHRRTDWAREEFLEFEDEALYERATEEKIRRVKGSGSLTGPQLAVLRELLAWREQVALRVNRPPRVVLKDYLLVEISRHSLRTHRELRELRGLNLSNRDVRSLCDVVTRALELPSSSWPTPAPREVESPQETALVAFATAVIRSYCLEHQLAYGLVATQKAIRQLVRHHSRAAGADPVDESKVELLRGWRGKSIGVLIDDVLSGRRFVRVDHVNGEYALHITPAAKDTGPAA